MVSYCSLKRSLLVVLRYWHGHTNVVLLILAVTDFFVVIQNDRC